MLRLSSSPPSLAPQSVVLASFPSPDPFHSSFPLHHSIFFPPLYICGFLCHIETPNNSGPPFSWIFGFREVPRSRKRLLTVKLSLFCGDCILLLGQSGQRDIWMGPRWTVRTVKAQDLSG